MGCATGLVKIVVFIFNFIFVLAGLALITLGILFKLALNSEVYNDAADNLNITAIFCIVLGSIVFFISFLGCCGVIKESTCMLTSYSVILIILLCLQVAIGVYVFMVFKDVTDLNTALSKMFKENFAKYNENEFIQDFFNENQLALKCCGVDGPQDYISTLHLNNPPGTCCGINDKQENCPIDKAYKDGCGVLLRDALVKSANIIGIVVISIAATELIGAILVLCLVSSIKNEYRRGAYA